MRDKHLDRLIERAGSKYTLVVAVAKRAQQLRDGAPPLVDVKSSNPVTVALAEIATQEVLVNPDELATTVPARDRGQPSVPGYQDDEDLDLFAGMDLATSDDEAGEDEPDDDENLNDDGEDS